MHEHLIKWLSEIRKKTEREVPYMLALREGFLVIQSFIVMPEKRLFLAWNQNRHIT